MYICNLKTKRIKIFSHYLYLVNIVKSFEFSIDNIMFFSFNLTLTNLYQ